MLPLLSAHCDIFLQKWKEKLTFEFIPFSFVLISSIGLVADIFQTLKIRKINNNWNNPELYILCTTLCSVSKRNSVYCTILWLRLDYVKLT